MLDDNGLPDPMDNGWNKAYYLLNLAFGLAFLIVTGLPRALVAVLRSGVTWRALAGLILGLVLALVVWGGLALALILLFRPGVPPAGAP